MSVIQKRNSIMMEITNSCLYHMTNSKCPLTLTKDYIETINVIRGAALSSATAALSSATQHAMPPEIGRTGERSVLTLGSLCLPCCVRDTA